MGVEVGEGEVGGDQRLLIFLLILLINDREHSLSFIGRVLNAIICDNVELVESMNCT